MTTKFEGQYQQVRFNDDSFGNYAVARNYFMELLRLRNDRVVMFNALCRYARDPKSDETGMISRTLKSYHPQFGIDLIEAVKLATRPRHVKPEEESAEKLYNNLFHRGIRPQFDLITMFRNRTNGKQPANVKPKDQITIEFEVIMDERDTRPLEPFDLPTNQLRPITAEPMTDFVDTVKELRIDDEARSLMWNGDDDTSSTSALRPHHP